VAQTVNMPTSEPSRKVTAATAGAVVSGFVLWLLSEFVFKGDVPEPVVLLVALVVPGALTFLAGYVTKRAAREVTPGRAP